MNRLSVRLFVVAGAMCFATAHSVLALGFRNPDQGARATAQGEAFVAQADDASAIWYNPAGLTQLDGTHLTSGLYLSFPDIEFQSAFVGEVEPKNRPVLLPHVYLASDFGLERLRFGLGLNMPYGNDIDWPEDAPFGYSVISSQLRVVNVAPTVAYQLTDWISVGAGLNYFFGDTEVYRALMAGVDPLYLPAEGRFKYKGNGDGLGFNVGLMFTPHPQHSVGVIYRSQINMDFSDNNAATVSIPGFGTVLAAPAKSKLDLPQSVAVGYAFRPTARLKLEFDVEWTDWNTLNSVTLSSPHPLVNGQQLTFNWESSLFYEFGVQYELNDTWMLHGGYIFSENTVPDATFSPTMPDADRHVFSVGAGFAKGHVMIDVTYQFSLSEDRTISAPVGGDPGVIGQWSSQGHALMVTSTWKF